MYIAVLGFQPNLSLAELKTTQQNTRQHSREVATFSDRPKTYLGGSIKTGVVIDEINSTRVNEIYDHIVENIYSYVTVSESKISVGVSIYGKKWPGYKSLCFDIKKRLKELEYKPRIVLGNKQTLSSAQILHNKLDQARSEIIVSVGETSTLIATTTWVQDIESYTKRDMQRPCRDMETGMLPPKLAQIMVNLAGGSYVFDPFCGSGVILQEALLMNKKAAGSDTSTRMIACSEKNLAWLEKEFNTLPPETLFTADARELSVPESVDSIVTEGYLGPIITKPPSPDYIQKLATESNELISATLKNLRPQLKKGTPLCLALPAWKHGEQIITPQVVSDYESPPKNRDENPSADVDDAPLIGYNRLRQDDISTSDLLYKRHDQYVGRQLILLEKS